MLLIVTLQGGNSVLAQNYQVSLLTCDPGEELYSAFGHNAVRVLDLETGRDIVFNYGTFDFDTPNFYVKFARGKLDYMLSVSTYEQFILHYQYLQRSVREQVLDLSPEQTLRMVQFLQENYQPENRFYRYDFFFDNCATRIRDMIEIVLGDQLKWDESKGSMDKSFRDLIDEYVYRMPWADFGIDLALGSVIDRKATEREKQFLPDYMEIAFSKAMIVGDGPSRPLIKSSSTVLEMAPPELQGSIFNPYLLFWVLALVGTAFTYVGFKKKRLYIGMDVLLFGTLGITGVVIFFLWFFTDHSATLYNWNILWAFPLHLVLVFGLWSSYPGEWVRKYLMFALIMADAAVVFWILGWQSFHPSILPLLLIIILRTNYLYYNLERLKSLQGNKGNH
ncbi:MAG: DUF4105 domain-containing protein [Anditalea sp.]